jgi:hypothetical protein
MESSRLYDDKRDDDGRGEVHHLEESVALLPHELAEGLGAKQEASPLGQAKKAFVSAAHAEGRYQLNEVSSFGTKCRRTGGSTFVCSWLWIRSGPYHNEEITATVTHEHGHYYVGPFSSNE